MKNITEQESKLSSRVWGNVKNTTKEVLNLGKKVWIFITVLSIVFTVLSYIINFLPYSVGEFNLSIIENSKKQKAIDFFKKNILIVDVSDNVDITVSAEEKEEMRLKEIVNTRKTVSRQKISELFKKLNDMPGNMYSVAICDVHFSDFTYTGNIKDTTNADSIVKFYASELQYSNRMIFGVSKELSGANELIKYEDESIGNISFDPFSDHYVMSSIKDKEGLMISLPFLMLERINHVTLNKHELSAGPFCLKMLDVNMADGKIKKYWNSFLPSIVIDEDDVFSLKPYEGGEATSDINIVNLNYISLRPEVLDQFLSDTLNPKFVFIANLQNMEDVHRTMWGDKAGYVILLNTYYYLLQGKAEFSWKLTLSLFVIYMILFTTIYYHAKILNRNRKIKNDDYAEPKVKIQRELGGFAIDLFWHFGKHYWYYIFFLIVWFLVYWVLDFYLRIITLAVVLLVVQILIKTFYDIVYWWEDFNLDKKE